VKSLPALVFILFVSVACNPQDSTNLQRDASNLGKSATRAAANATVAGKVNAALALRKGVSLKNLHLEAEGSIVTISGHVGSALEKRTVLDVATNTVGVDRVIDKIRVQSPDQPTKPTG
jgi:osmotically-inducible protein OsmY